MALAGLYAGRYAANTKFCNLNYLMQVIQIEGHAICLAPHETALQTL